MLTSDDPPIPNEKHDRLETRPGPAVLIRRVIAPVRHAVAFVPTLGRRIIRVDDEPSRWQLAGIWTSGSAIVAGTGLTVAAVIGGAPPALTQQLDRLSVLPGLSGGHSDAAPAMSADNAKRDTARTSSGGTKRDRTSAEDSGSSSYGGYSGVPGVPAGASFPDDVVLPGLPAARDGAPRPGTSHTGPPAGGSGSTAPAPGDSSSAPTDDPPPVVDPTETAPPVVDPTETAPPVVDPTETAPDPTPTDTPPADPPADPPPADPPQGDPVADPAPADNAVDSPPADPAPAHDPQGATPVTPDPTAAP
jgi:hypothetical protein